jgi:hypothetical protein
MSSREQQRAYLSVHFTPGNRTRSAPRQLAAAVAGFVYAALLCSPAIPRCCAALRSRVNCHLCIESVRERERVALMGIRMSGEWLCAALLQPAQHGAVTVPHSLSVRARVAPGRRLQVPRESCVTHLCVRVRICAGGEG